MKTFLVIVVALGIFAGGGYAYLHFRAPAKDIKATEQATETIKVEKGTIDLRVSTTGKVSSNLDVEVKSKASGQITKLPFDMSDEVTSGALLVELDPVDENRNVELRRSSLASARARLAQAQENLRIALIDVDTGTSKSQADLEAARIKHRDSKARLARQEELFTKHLISKEELDSARTDAASAANALLQAEARVAEALTLPRTVEIRRQDVQLQEAAVKTAQVDLDNALQRLKETRIFAPMDGVVTERKVQTGQIIASGISNVGGGTTLMTLSDLSKLYVCANVDESDIGKVKKGQRALITADAYPGRRFRGEVVRISPKGTENSNVVTFEVKILVGEEGRDLLKPSMTTNVEIQADRHEDVLVLPNHAVQYSREGYVVEVPDGPGKTRKQKVKTGLTDGLNTEIMEGVTEGMQVAVSSSLQSKWVQGQQQGGGGFDRGMRMATFRMSGMGRSGGGGRH